MILRTIDFDQKSPSLMTEEEKIGQNLMPIEYKEADKDLQFGLSKAQWLQTFEGAANKCRQMALKAEPLFDLLNILKIA